MAPIYSTSFSVAQIAPGQDATLYTVAAGFVAVLRDVELLTVAVGDYVAIKTQGANLILIEGQPVGAYFHGQWQGRLTTGAGNSFVAHNFGANSVALALSGYLLKA